MWMAAPSVLEGFYMHIFEKSVDGFVFVVQICGLRLEMGLLYSKL